MDDTANAEQRAISIDEFCRRYSVSRTLAYSLINSGQLPTARLGTRRLIPVEAAERLFQESMNSGGDGKKKPGAKKKSAARV